VRPKVRDAVSEEDLVRRLRGFILSPFAISRFPDEICLADLAKVVHRINRADERRLHISGETAEDGNRLLHFVGGLQRKKPLGFRHLLF